MKAVGNAFADPYLEEKSVRLSTLQFTVENFLFVANVVKFDLFL